MKKTSLTSVILFGICAVIWSVKAVLSLVGIIEYSSSVSDILITGDVLCALLWSAAFVWQLIRYRSGKKQ